MKLITFILIISLTQVTAATFGQSVTLRQNNVSLAKLFYEIRKQTGYDVLIKDTKFETEQRINANFSNTPLAKVMDRVVAGTNLVYNIDNMTVVIKEKEEGFVGQFIRKFQEIDIKGRILDEKNNPLPGASVKVKNTNKIAVSDESGVFEIKDVETDALLVVTFMGYKPKEVKVSGHTSFEIQMELSSSVLNQVMITGYQRISRERATGSFSTISREMLDKRPTSDLSSSLLGTVAGMQGKEKEDGSINFLIRGNTSLLANKSPLIVVDGFPISGTNFSDINPNDVESVTVLKDAAAASIWGARSANGVIVVTTKKSKKNNELQVNANAFTRISNRVDLKQVLTQANSSDQVAYERKAFENNWHRSSSYTGSFYYDIVNSLTLAQELLYAHQNNKIDVTTMNSGLDRLSKIDNRSQIQDLLMQHAVLNQYNIDLQVGTDRSTTYGSMMYESDKGSFKKNGYNRFNLNFNNDFKLNNFLNLNFGANLQYKNRETSGATISEIQNLSPYEILRNPDGSYGTNLKEYNREMLETIPAGSFPFADWSYNLLQEVDGRKFTDKNLSARIQAGLNLKLLKGLTFDSKFQYERTKIDYEDYYNESTFFVRSLVNSMTTYDGSGTPGISYIPKGGISRARDLGFEAAPPYRDVRVNNSDLEGYLIRNQFNLDQRLGQKHSISVIAGMEMSQSTTSSKGNPTVYGYFPDKLQSTLPPYGYGSAENPLSDFLDGYFSNTVPGGDSYYSWLRDKYVSFYSNASYTYDDKYTVSGSARSDASNFITDKPSMRWSPLWSVGVKWDMKKESFMASVAPIDRLALRLTYGKNGNVEKSTSTQPLLNVSSSPNVNTGTIVATVSSNGNPTLRWEKTTTTNLGIDFSLFGNRLFGSIDLYNKIGEGIMGDIAVPSYTGTRTQLFNNAGILNRGIELTLGAEFRVPNTPVRYNTSLTYAYNYNKVTSLYNPSLYVDAYLDGAFVEGKPVNAIYSLTYKGMLNGVPQVEGPNGSLASFNQVALINATLGNYLNEHNYEGSGTPPHTLGWVNNIQMGDFTLTAVFDGTFGGVYRNPVFNYSSATIGSGKTFVNKYVKDVFLGNPNIPGFPNPEETEVFLWDRYAPYLKSLIESSSYIECKELTLGYTIPTKLAKAIQVNKINVFLQSRNLGLIWAANSKRYNPDWLPGSNRPVQTYTFGVNFKF